MKLNFVRNSSLSTIYLCLHNKFPAFKQKSWENQLYQNICWVYQYKVYEWYHFVHKIQNLENFFLENVYLTNQYLYNYAYFKTENGCVILEGCCSDGWVSRAAHYSVAEFSPERSGQSLASLHVSELEGEGGAQRPQVQMQYCTIIRVHLVFRNYA